MERRTEWLRHAKVATGGVVLGAAILSFAYYLSIGSLSGPISYPAVLRWQLASWLIWVAIAPTVIAVLKPILGRSERHTKAIAIVIGVGIAALVAQAIWIGFVAVLFSPYPTLTNAINAVAFHTRYGLAINLALLALLVVIASRAVAAEALAADKDRAVQALLESERRFKDFFENAVFGIFRSTPDGKFLMLNRSGANAMGYESPEDVFAEVSNIASQVYADPSDRQRYLEAMRRDGQVTNWIWKMRRRDGSILWNSETARAVFDDDGKILFLEGTAKDITAEVEARDALQQSERRSAELRAQLADAQLRALKLQIKPHFLFNILNTVAMMIRTDETDKAQQVVTMLGSLFRRFLEFEGEDTVTLDQELAFVDLYLGLERFRFEDRIRIERDIDPETLGLPVPTLILQPLVENAIKHGLAHMSGVCRLSLRASRDNGSLVIELANDMAAGSATRDGGYGIGLANTRARLKEFYEGRADFELITRTGTAVAVIRIPITEEAP